MQKGPGVRRPSCFSIALLLLVTSFAGAQSYPEGPSVAYGVKLQLDLPVTDAARFIANPFGYAAQQRDVIDARAFLELARYGIEGRYRSATEAYLGGYYILGLSALLGQRAESTIGVYLGRNLREHSTFLTLRGTLLLYGSF